MRKPDFGLYLVTDRNLAAAGDIVKAVEAALSGGVKAVQLREKDLAGGELLILARRLRDVTRASGAKLLINGRADVALASGADGVHLGQSDIKPDDARVMLGKDVLIGVSAHNTEEAVEAEDRGADFITFGPVYKTPSKEKYGEPAGLGALKDAAARLTIPVFAIGGVKEGLAGEAVQNGASGIAVISAIIGDDDPKEAAARLLNALRTAKESRP